MKIAEYLGKYYGQKPIDFQKDPISIKLLLDIDLYKPDLDSHKWPRPCMLGTRQQKLAPDWWINTRLTRKCMTDEPSSVRPSTFNLFCACVHV